MLLAQDASEAAAERIRALIDCSLADDAPEELREHAHLLKQEQLVPPSDRVRWLASIETGKNFRERSEDRPIRIALGKEPVRNLGAMRRNAEGRQVGPQSVVRLERLRARNHIEVAAAGEHQMRDRQ